MSMNDVERILAREAIKETKARYCLTLDTKDVPAMTTLFTEDAWLDASEALSVRDPKTGEFDRPVYAGTCSGGAAIAQFIIDSVAAFRTCHQVHSPIIEFSSPTEASVLWAMEDNLYCSAGTPFKAMHGLGHYHETYRKIGELWRIHRLRLTRLNVTIVE
jgi:hypothetical protein